MKGRNRNGNHLDKMKESKGKHPKHQMKKKGKLPIPKWLETWKEPEMW